METMGHKIRRAVQNEAKWQVKESNMERLKGQRREQGESNQILSPPAKHFEPTPRVDGDCFWVSLVF